MLEDVTGLPRKFLAPVARRLISFAWGDRQSNHRCRGGIDTGRIN